MIVILLQVHTFYEAVGMMIGAQTDPTAQEHLLEKYMALPNQVWDSIISQATQVTTSDFVQSHPSSSCTSLRATTLSIEPSIIVSKSPHSCEHGNVYTFRLTTLMA